MAHAFSCDFAVTWLHSDHQDVMMRKKTALSLDSRYETMIENAYFYSNPPDNTQSAQVERPPMHNYIRRLLYKDLSKITTEKVHSSVDYLLTYSLIPIAPGRA